MIVKPVKFIIATLLILSIVACSNTGLIETIMPTQTIEGETASTPSVSDVTESTAVTPINSSNQPTLEEVAVVTLKIPEGIQAPSFEYSGMAWYGDVLVLLPQFPDDKEGNREPNLFAITKDELILAAKDPSLELTVRDVPIVNSDLRSVIKGYEGFESILFVGQDVYLTIESRAGNPMMGYLIRGEVTGDLESITLDPESLVELQPLSKERNATFEAMTFWNGSLYIIYEHNSRKNVAQPVAYQYSLDLEFQRQIPFPLIDFRVTDATISDPSGLFWVVNYFYPGDTHLAVEQDALVLEYGEGKTHAASEPVERLVQLQIEADQISRVDQAPIYLQLLDYNIARNWEGVVLLDDLGFLLISDSFPGSLLGFCPFLSWK